MQAESKLFNILYNLCTNCRQLILHRICMKEPGQRPRLLALEHCFATAYGICSLFLRMFPHKITRVIHFEYIYSFYIFSCPTEFSCILVILFSVSFTFCTFLSYPNREPVKCTYVYVCVIYTERCIPYASFSFSEIKWNE